MSRREKIYLDTRVRVVIKKDHTLTFIPEVLILHSEIDWETNNIFYELNGNRYGEEFTKAENLYLSLFGKSVEWCPIKKTRSVYSDGRISIHRGNYDISRYKIELKTLKGAKGVIDAFKAKNKDYF